MRLGLVLIGTALAVLLGGCKFNHPAGEKTGASVDESYVGVWRAQGGKSDEEPPEAVVSRVSDSVLAVRLGELKLEAWHVDLPHGASKGDLLQTKTGGPLGGILPYSIFVLTRHETPEGEALVALMLKAPEQKTLDTPRAVRAYAQESLAGLPLLTSVDSVAKAARLPNWDSYVFVRKGGSNETAQTSPTSGQALASAAPSAAAPAGNTTRKFSDVEMLLVDCEQGGAPSCTDLARRYKKGDGVANDLARALAFFERACVGGDAHGCFYLGVMKEEGEGGPVDEPAARAAYGKACGNGDASGCFNLGLMKANGEGGSVDKRGARVAYEKACDGDIASGCFNLALLRWNGEGGLEDESGALAAFRRACDGGHEKACGAALDLGTKLEIDRQLKLQ